MIIKYILTVALIMPFLTVSSMAQQYVGGPKSGTPTTRQISGGDIYAQGGDIYARGGGIYARGGDIYARGAYRGGQTVVPRGY